MAESRRGGNKKERKGKNVCEKRRRLDRLKMREGGMCKTRYWGTKKNNYKLHLHYK
jgi:hypothetical protein